MKYFDIMYSVLGKWYVSFAKLTPKLIVAIIVFALAILFSTYLSKIFVKFINKVFPTSKNHDSLVNLVGFIRFLIVLAGSFIALEIMGFGGFILNFIGSLGVAGVIAGVALKDLVSSIFSGMLVSVDKAFKVGDYITISNNSGTVEEIGFLTTKIINDEGKKVYIPNQLIFSAPFINITASEHRKVIIDLEINTSENLENVKKVLLDEVLHFEFSEEPEKSEVVFVRQKLGIYNLQVKFWMKNGENFVNVRSEAFLKLKNRMDIEGISMVNPLQNITPGST